MTRKEAREALVTLFAGQGFTTVNAFLPLNLGGTDKILNIFARGSGTQTWTADNKKDFHVFNLDVLVRRRGTVADDDDLDTLHDAIATVCKANHVNPGVWQELDLDGDTETRTVHDAGTPYRLERHRVKLKLTG